jgi:hypothetical protein
MMDTTQECAWLHKILSSCPIVAYPFDVEKLPKNGIYFFYEKGELNTHDDKLGIVRVGTHKGDNFRSRISEHYLLDGMKRFDNNSPAPKDRSIFRKNIGRALLNKKNSEYLPIWEQDFTTKAVQQKYRHKRDTAFEYSVETEITGILRKTFNFRFIEIDDQELRMGKKGLEGRLIGTLSHCRLCKPSSQWLGNHSPKKQIRESGLWLIQHLNDDGITVKDKDLISRLIAGKCMREETSIVRSNDG